MTTALRAIGHDDRLSLVDHLDELRKRIIVSVAAFAICFAVCAWQNDFILDALNEPLAKATTGEASRSGDALEQSSTWQQRMRDVLVDLRALAETASASDDPVVQSLALQLRRSAGAAAAATPRASPRRPVTLGVSEPFLTTVRIAGYAALLLSMPILLFQLYAFVLPAFSPTERQVALPLMLAVPFLFIAGALFAYFVVLPNAVRFLQNFNDDNFDILIQAKDYYRFSVLILVAMGLLFQIPIAILGVTRMGILSVTQLRRNRRYALLVIAILAMLLPGTDPVTMLLAMAPLILLFEGSILLAGVLDRRVAKARAREEAEMAAANDAELAPLEPDDPSD
jgi:sec-independent protein translocase protein TatC